MLWGWRLCRHPPIKKGGYIMLKKIMRFFRIRFGKSGGIDIKVTGPTVCGLTEIDR